MEISVGNSGGSKTKSLDLKTLYKSEVSNKGASVKKGKEDSWVENGEGTEVKKRKSRKEVASSTFEDLKERKKVKHSTDDTQVDGQKINGGSGFNAIGINVSSDGHGVLIPKRPRGSFGRSKFANSHLLKASDSVENVVKLKDGLQNEVSDSGEPVECEETGPIVKLNGKSGVKARTKQKGVAGSIGNQKQESAAVTSSHHAKSNSGSLGSEGRNNKVKDEIPEVSRDKVPGADASSSLGSKEKEVPGVSGNSTSTSTSKGKLRNNGKENGIDGNQKIKEDSAKGEGTDLDLVVVNNKDSKRNRRKRKLLGSNSEKKGESRTCDLDPDDDLEQNAARMLSSRFDPSCTGFASKNRTSALSSENNGESMGGSADAADRVLRPRRQQKGKGTSRKRRHFYEIHSDDMDAHWFLNRKIKIFWPLDESWYYGLVNDYDAEKNLHHIKYDDRDEEWISLENERFKLLLLPSEVPCKPTHKDTCALEDMDEGFMASHMESEPIISWLSHRSPSISLKKQKLISGDDAKRETNDPSCRNKDKSLLEGHLPIVYVRRRFRRFNDGTRLPFGGWELDSSVMESNKFKISISLWPMLTYVLGADLLWLVRSILLLQNGTLVTMWPSVFLEVLFVDNNVGLRLFLFQGCLTQAVAFVFLVIKVFCEPAEKDESVDHQVPVTSIRFKLSFSHNFRKHKVFAYYSFSKVRDSHWNYLNSVFHPHCLLTKQLSLRECTYDNIKLLEAGMQHSQIPIAPQTTYFEVSRKKLNPGGVPLVSSPRSVHGNRPSTIYSWKHGNLPPFALSFTAAPNFFLSLHLKLLLERSITCFSVQDQDSIHPPVDNHSHQFEISSESSSFEDAAALVSVDGGSRKSSSSQFVVDENLNVNNTTSTSKATNQTETQIGNSNRQLQKSNMSVEIPTSNEVKTPGTQDVTCDGIICSPNPTVPRSLWHRNSKSFGETDFIGNGPKKPRTQVQYTMPSREFSFKNKGYQRIRKANDKKTSDASKGPRRNLEMVACDANILINGGDKGWRECGARVFLEVADQNEWKLAVKCSGVLKYAYKVHQDLQPGSTNRYTHAMMWKGGKDWALEFPDRSQWFVFKEMHEECHNRNIRAASIKNIPIPGVRLIEDSFDDQDEMPFVRSPWYFHQGRNDVEMAMDASHVMYDMDSEDEEWVSKRSEEDMISDELFEKVMDMLEKVSYAQKRDHFTSAEIEELVARVTPMQLARSIYEHWREKRQRKGMPLIRQLQPPLWERYQQICREWDELNPKAAGGGGASGSQEKASAADKPPMFAFCLKPRGLELLNKGSKHRPHKKISLSGHSHAFLPDHDNHHSSGRRYMFGDERAECSDVSPVASKMYSPREGSGPNHFSLVDGGDASELRIQRNNSNKSIKAIISPKTSSTLRKPSATAAAAAGKRNNLRNNHNQPSPPYRHPGQLLLGGSDLDEFRLRDASSAAKHARNMAKLKRERAQKLMLSADLAIHKAVSALMTAEAIKAFSKSSTT